MRRLSGIVLLLCFFNGCTLQKEIDHALAFRSQLMKSEGCTFQCSVVADYGTDVYNFLMECTLNTDGTLNFQMIEPETIRGITGILSDKRGKITFRNQAAAFPDMADGQVIPVYTPWILLTTLRSGYIRAGGMDEEAYHVMIDDSYKENAIHTEIWLDSENCPIRGEIFWDGKRILAAEFSQFQFL